MLREGLGKLQFALMVDRREPDLLPDVPARLRRDAAAGRRLPADAGFTTCNLLSTIGSVPDRARRCVVFLVNSGRLAAAPRARRATIPGAGRRSSGRRPRRRRGTTSRSLPADPLARAAARPSARRSRRRESGGADGPGRRGRSWLGLPAALAAVWSGDQVATALLGGRHSSRSAEPGSTPTGSRGVSERLSPSEPGAGADRDRPDARAQRRRLRPLADPDRGRGDGVRDRPPDPRAAGRPVIRRVRLPLALACAAAAIVLALGSRSGAERLRLRPGSGLHPSRRLPIRG